MKVTLCENALEEINYELGKAHGYINDCFINGAILRDSLEEDVINNIRKDATRCVSHLEYLLKSVNELSEWLKEVKEHE